MGIVSTLLRAATWWNGQTLNTQLFTWRRGVKVGEDDAGNMFYETSASQASVEPSGPETFQPILLGNGGT